MKMISAIINSLLATFIVLSGTTFVVNKVADAQYLNDTAEKSGVYKGVSEVVSRRLIETSANNLGVSPEQIPAEVSNVVSEQYISAKSQDVTSQIEATLRGERDKIVIDISDLAAQAQAAGLSINASDLKPIEIEAPKQENGQGGVRIAQNIDLLRFISYLLTAILFMASVTLSIIRKRLHGLALALLSSGFTFAMFALFGTLISSTVIDWVKLPETVTEITPYAQTFARTILGEVSGYYGWFALGLVVISVVLFTVDRMLKKRLTERQAAAAPASHFEQVISTQQNPEDRLNRR